MGLDARCCAIRYVSVVDILFFYLFFFKQKTAYEMLRSLVGSEMCIRDRCETHIEGLRRRCYHADATLIARNRMSTDFEQSGLSLIHI